MRQLMSSLHEDHQQISVLLTILKNKLATLEGGGRPNFALMAEVVDYLADYAGTFHHDMEDVIYQVMLERHPGSSSLLNQQLEDHEALDKLTLAFADQVEAALMDSPVSIDAFALTLARFIERQQQHLAVEENKVFPLAERILTEADWQQINTLLPARPDPKRQAEFQARYAHLAQALIEDLA